MSTEARTVLVTGTSSGIGRATALTLDRAGYRVFAGVRDDTAAAALRAEGSSRLTPIALDVTDRDQIAAAVAQLGTALGGDSGLTALVNNAGVVVPGPLEFMPMDQVRAHFEVNVFGHIALTQACLPLLRRGRGRVISITSGAAQYPLPYFSAYSGSKAATEAMLDALRRELRPWNLPVVIVEPGMIATPMWTKGYAAFDAMLDALPTEARELYAHRLAAGRELVQRAEGVAQSPEAVARAIRRAIEARRPRTRYAVGLDAKLARQARHLADRINDWICGVILRGR
jgi:NAD(P)-dependent dehydrogenase (short-subunit alcohol dehydrogenase family)